MSVRDVFMNSLYAILAYKARGTWGRVLPLPSNDGIAHELDRFNRIE